MIQLLYMTALVIFNQSENMQTLRFKYFENLTLEMYMYIFRMCLEEYIFSESIIVFGYKCKLNQIY